MVDSGWYPYPTQIGQTGKVVSPKVYIGFGVSGAIQHKVGMQTSQVIIAINKDGNAPIFEFTDLGVVGDLNSRRGQIQGTDSRGNAQVVEALVPLANMFGYVNQLRSFTQGRAQYTMQFSHYDEVPANVAQEVKEKLA